MNHKALLVIMAMLSLPLYAAPENQSIEQEIKRLQRETNELQSKLAALRKQTSLQSQPGRTRQADDALTQAQRAKQPPPRSRSKKSRQFHSSAVSVHAFDGHPESLEFYPTALVADDHVVTYIAGTPIVSSPYLGERPAFDGSDYIVNISSINRDIRLMQQRRQLYRAYQTMGYPVPHKPIIAFSGAVVPFATIGSTYFRQTISDVNLGMSELDVAAALNDKVEGYMAFAYDDAPPSNNGQRVANSALFLNMGFVNIGNLERSPLYFTAGQLYVPFGRFSSAMISAPLPRQIGRTRTRPVIFGYKSQENTGPYAAIYGFKSDTTLGGSGVGGLNVGYVFGNADRTGEIGASFISSVNDAHGMQDTGSIPGTTFGGFASITNGNEAVRQVPALDLHANISFDRYNLTAEWVSATSTFRPQDLSFNAQGARPSAGQLEAGVTFMAFEKPASAAIGYQWSRQALALNLPAQRFSGVFNISIWKDTVESLEYRYETDYQSNQFANGAAPLGSVNANTLGTGKSANTLLAQIGVYF